MMKRTLVLLWRNIQSKFVLMPLLFAALPALAEPDYAAAIRADYDASSTYD